MVSSPPLTPTLHIPDSVHPPIPGESHRYYGNIHKNQVKLPSTAQTSHASRLDIDGSVENDLDIHEATAAGNMARVKELLDPRGSGEATSAFLLANEASSSSGLTPLHYAASRGHLEIVKWLIIDAGAIVDLEDQTGETALLKAAYSGHADVVAWLVRKQANIEQKDNDGWTALHNASAQGYLPIVKHLLEIAHADVDVKSKNGHTPLMNAASKGHINIVEYLLDRGGANPLIKNKFGETAYDAAAISHEVYICELLEKAEREWWKGKKSLPQASTFDELIHMPNTNQPYDLYAFHITVPIILHENQRSSSSFGLSIRGPSKYSANSLLKTDVRGPWSYPSGKPQSKDNVRLPSGISSSVSSASVLSTTSSKPSHRPWFWVSDEWQIDLSHPRVDSQGWQYSKSFDDPDGMWTASPQSTSGGWVRRRRWVRVMKRQVDVSENGVELQLVSNSENDTPDYIESAESIVKKNSNNSKGKAVELSISEQLIKYKEAIEILSSGIKTDLNAQRKQQAISIFRSFTSHVETLEYMVKGNDGAPRSPSLHDVPITPNLSKSPSPILPFRSDISTNPSKAIDKSTITNLRAPSTASIEVIENPWKNAFPSEDVGNAQPSIYENQIVSPTRAHPQTGINMTNASGHSISSGYKWENDEDVNECRRCKGRRCGQVVCAKCSSARVQLHPSQVLNPSGSGETSQTHQYHRVCSACFASIGLTPRPRANSFTSTSLVGGASSVSHSRRMSSSSTMTECPACSTTLSKFGGKEAQEEHVQQCLDKSGNSVSGYKYV
ncbi:21822_t:CDS:2, partial [Gigaspora rosea]